MWAGIKKALSSVSKAISKRSLESIPKIGLPSEEIFPIRSNLSLNLITEDIWGMRMR